MIQSSLGTPKKNTDGFTPEDMNAYHPKFRAAIQERHEVLPLILQHHLTSQNPIGSSSRVLAFGHKNILNLQQLGEIPGEMMSGILGGIRANGTKTNCANLSRSSIFPRRIGDQRWHSFSDRREV